MKRVVFLKSRLSHLGGLEKYTRRLADAFARQECRVQILTTGRGDSWEGVEVISLGETSKFSLEHLRRFDLWAQNWVQKEEPEIIFGMERNTFQTHYRAGSGVHAVYLKQRAFVDSWFKRLTFSFNPLHRYLLSVEKEAFEHKDLRLLFTNSHMVKREIIQTYATPQEKIQVVHNGVEWSEKEMPFHEGFKKKRGGPLHFLFVGSGFKRKGLLFLLNGLSKLTTPYRLTVVGNDRDLAFYKKKAPHVDFVGPQNDVTPFYQGADALVIPSIYDPFANVTLEALAMGLFVISSPFNGGSEVLTPNSGVIIKDLFDCSEELKQALDFPKTLERGTAIRQSIKELDFSYQLDKIVQLTLC